MMPTATPPVFATRTAALQPTTTLSATGAGLLFAWDRADRSLDAEYNKFIKEWIDDL